MPDWARVWGRCVGGGAGERTCGQAGRCGAARKVYGDHVDDADDSVRARALAGLGLCALAEGDSKAADAYFSRAKKADGRVGSFISRERAKIEAQPDAKAGKKQSL